MDYMLRGSIRVGGVALEPEFAICDAHHHLLGCRDGRIERRYIRACKWCCSQGLGRATPLAYCSVNAVLILSAAAARTSGFSICPV